MAKEINRKDSSQVKIYINDALSEKFDSKLKEDGIKKKDLLVTAIYSYLEGESATSTKDGKEIYFRCKTK